MNTPHLLIAQAYLMANRSNLSGGCWINQWVYEETIQPNFNTGSIAADAAIRQRMESREVIDR